MPKMKTHSGAKKRFKKLKSGKIKARKAFKRHLLEKKSESRKRRLSLNNYIQGGDLKKLKRLMPN
ncbi:50S ribosomal protein L35 [bacterium]|jgi:large subunit ribosomal protein L35|nr:50S ribosomal protein L35 [bacterium]MBT3904014.1 50S ribosomal protein L35 [bacterium]MBT4577439.1 50S ribosomal protein L35 [bacterium]MBT5345976.1 50S ribosomal protein L35 [bacterium]MBT6130762.1 50S ribosomal protein L35 [bacterium]